LRQARAAPDEKRDGVDPVDDVTAAGDAAGHRGSDAAGRCAADVLALAAAPTFVLMACASAVAGDDPMGMLCSAAHGSPLGGMAVMYGLMGVFHLAPWLRWMARRRSGNRRKDDAHSCLAKASIASPTATRSPMPS
jgi:hypothetical protein